MKTNQYVYMYIRTCIKGSGKELSVRGWIVACEWGGGHVVLHPALHMWADWMLRFCSVPGGDGGLGSSVSWGGGNAGKQLID